MSSNLGIPVSPNFVALPQQPITLGHYLPPQMSPATTSPIFLAPSVETTQAPSTSSTQIITVNRPPFFESPEFVPHTPPGLQHPSSQPGPPPSPPLPGAAPSPPRLPNQSAPTQMSIRSPPSSLTGEWEMLVQMKRIVFFDPERKLCSLSSFRDRAPEKCKRNFASTINERLVKQFSNGYKLNKDDNWHLCKHSTYYVVIDEKLYQWVGALMKESREGISEVRIMLAYMIWEGRWSKRTALVKVTIADGKVRVAETQKEIEFKLGFKPSPVCELIEEDKKLEVKGHGPCVLAMNHFSSSKGRMEDVPFLRAEVYTGSDDLAIEVSVDDISEFKPAEPLLEEPLTTQLHNQIVVLSTSGTSREACIKTLEDHFNRSTEKMMVTIEVVRQMSGRKDRHVSRASCRSCDRPSKGGFERNSDSDSDIESGLNRESDSESDSDSESRIAIKKLVPGKQFVVFPTISKAEDQDDINELVRAKFHVIIIADDAIEAMNWLSSKAVLADFAGSLAPVRGDSTAGGAGESLDVANVEETGFDIVEHKDALEG